MDDKYAHGIPRVINLLCEHALTGAYVEEQRLIEPALIDEVAREFQLDEIAPIAAPGSLAVTQDVFNSESFVQNLGEALSRFRMGPSGTLPRDRK
jgi:2-hydroxychromene-2-carboxylate isomerase